MRCGRQNVGVKLDNGQILLSFGFGYCAEHEWGIDRIKSALGISSNSAETTVQRFKVTTAEDGNNIILHNATVGKGDDKHSRIFLLGGRLFFGNLTVDQYVVMLAGKLEPNTVQAMWDSDSFLFSVPETDHEQSTALIDLHQALIANDALIYVADRDNPFGGTGLIVTRLSTLPQSGREKMESSLVDQHALTRAAERTGIRERVDTWGKKVSNFHGIALAYYALSPRWMEGFATADDPRVSAYPVIFWLNPFDQKKYRYGWFTVEELDQWIAGKGPVVKEKA